MSHLHISDKLLCLFTTKIDEEDGEFRISIPAHEIETGTVDPGETYRVAIIASEGATGSPEAPEGPQRAPQEPQPPVEVGEIRYVEIEDIGKQGDGIARVERGYVIIVPGADMGEQVKIEITEVKSNFSVGQVIDEELV